MRPSRFALVLGALAVLPLIAVGAFAASVELEGKLQGAPLPATYNITGADLYFNHGKPYVEVRGEGDCHYEFHQECYVAGNPPQMICHQVPQWVCFQDRATYAMPASLVLRDKDVYFTGQGDHKIGTVKSFLFWTWIALADNAKLAVTTNKAVLHVDLGAGAPRPRAENFAKIYGEPTVDLMVKFQTVNVREARAIVRKAGYDGVLSPTNDWTVSDVTRDELGVRLPVRAAASLIAKLKQNIHVVGVRPAGTAAAE